MKRLREALARLLWRCVEALCWLLTALGRVAWSS